MGHRKIRTAANVNTTVLDQMADAVAHATLTFANAALPTGGEATGHGFAGLAFEGPSRLK